MSDFSPAGLYKDGQLFICITKEQFDELSAKGWNASPNPTAQWVPKWEDLKHEEPKKKQK